MAAANDNRPTPSCGAGVPLTFLVASLRAELRDLAEALPSGSKPALSVGRCLLLVTELEKHAQ